MAARALYVRAHGLASRRPFRSSVTSASEGGARTPRGRRPERAPRLRTGSASPGRAPGTAVPAPTRRRDSNCRARSPVRAAAAGSVARWRAWSRISAHERTRPPPCLRFDRIRRRVPSREPASFRRSGRRYGAWNSMESMIGVASATTSSKRATGAMTVIARVRIDMPSGRSTRNRRRRFPGSSELIHW
jgi:hypothetical protein